MKAVRTELNAQYAYQDILRIYLLVFVVFLVQMISNMISQIEFAFHALQIVRNVAVKKWLIAICAKLIII